MTDDAPPAPVTATNAGVVAHYVTVSTHVLPSPPRILALAGCACGWQEWTSTTDHATALALAHHASATAQDATHTPPTDPRSHPQDVRT